MMSTTMKWKWWRRSTVQSTEEEATQPLGSRPPSVYLFVLLLIGCHLPQNPICLGQLHLSSGILISQRKSLNSAVSTLPDPGVQRLSSLLPSSWCPFPCSCFQYLSLCSCPGALLHGLFTWANCPASSSISCRMPWTWWPPNPQGRVPVDFVSSIRQWQTCSQVCDWCWHEACSASVSSS